MPDELYRRQDGEIRVPIQRGVGGADREGGVYGTEMLEWIILSRKCFRAYQIPPSPSLLFCCCCLMELVQF